MSKKDFFYYMDYPQPYQRKEPVIRESAKLDGEPSNRLGNEVLFWHFPGMTGGIQPWRRRLWELQNHSNHD
ncbi:hypothetical protein SAMN03159358_4352 [Paenibacillus sp. NFR01]|nr:hypothetical protein SAMN03159358_4352 [Paenibacillus sp. NFR01]